MSPLAIVTAVALLAFLVALQVGFLLHASVPPRAVLEEAAWNQAVIASAGEPAQDVRPAAPPRG